MVCFVLTVHINMALFPNKLLGRGAKHLRRKSMLQYCFALRSRQPLCCPKIKAAPLAPKIEAICVAPPAIDVKHVGLCLDGQRAVLFDLYR